MRNRSVRFHDPVNWPAGFRAALCLPSRFETGELENRLDLLKIIYYL
jgi:hypothetical protein